MSSSPVQGYVFTSYGSDKYLRDAIVSAYTIRRHDNNRPIAICCSAEHEELLKKWQLDVFFNQILTLEPENQSIVGFKHNLHKFMPFDRNMYLDSDMILCRNPDGLWKMFEPYPYTITGQKSADVFYGAPKGWGVTWDILFRRRQRTLKRFNLTYLYRVQTGIMYNSDYDTAKKVNEFANEFLRRKDETHFISRMNEKGRSLESCEWSLGMALSAMNLHVVDWFNGQESPQLDYIHDLTKHDEDFHKVSVKYYCNPFIYSLRGIVATGIRDFYFWLFGILPRGHDHMWVTPYILHFGWGHQKKYWNAFSERMWEKIRKNSPD